MSDAQQEVHTIPCRVCALPQTVLTDLHQAPPPDVVCPHCLVGLAHLEREDAETWVRVAQIELPSDQKMWLLVTPSTEDELKNNPIGEIAHGDVLMCDEIGVGEAESDGDDDDDDRLAIRGQVRARRVEGRAGFSLTPGALGDPRVREILTHVLERARTRQTQD